MICANKLPKTPPKAIAFGGVCLLFDIHAAYTKSAVSDVRLSFLMIVSEFTSGNAEAVELAQLAT